MNSLGSLRPLLVAFGSAVVVYTAGLALGTLARIAFHIDSTSPEFEMFAVITRAISVMMVGFTVSYKMPSYELLTAVALGALTTVPGIIVSGASSSELATDVLTFSAAGLAGALPHYAYKKGHLKGERTRRIVGWALRIIGYPLVGGYATLITLQMASLQQGGHEPLMSVGQILLLGLPGMLGLLLATAGNRMLRPSGDQVLRSGQAYVLFLRAFSDDAIAIEQSAAKFSARDIVQPPPVLAPFGLLRSASRNDTFETAITEVVGVTAPVVAIARPGEELPPVSGALRISVGAAEWQIRVKELLRGCEVVLMLLGTSTGLQWEFHQALAIAKEKLIVVLPPIDSAALSERLSPLIAMFESLHIRVPPTPEDAKFLFVDGEEVKFVVARTASQEAYRQAYEVYRKTTGVGTNRVKLRPVA